MSKRFLDRDHPMFRRAWVRALTVAVPGLMAALEFSMNGPAWGILFGGAAIWALWELYLRP